MPIYQHKQKQKQPPLACIMVSQPEPEPPVAPGLPTAVDDAAALDRRSSLLLPLPAVTPLPCAVDAESASASHMPLTCRRTTGSSVIASPLTPPLEALFASEKVDVEAWDDEGARCEAIAAAAVAGTAAPPGPEVRETAFGRFPGTTATEDEVDSMSRSLKGCKYDGNDVALVAAAPLPGGPRGEPPVDGAAVAAPPPPPPGAGVDAVEVTEAHDGDTTNGLLDAREGAACELLLLYDTAGGHGLTTARRSSIPDVGFGFAAPLLALAAAKGFVLMPRAVVAVAIECSAAKDGGGGGGCANEPKTVFAIPSSPDPAAGAPDDCVVLIVVVAAVVAVVVTPEAARRIAGGGGVLPVLERLVDDVRRRQYGRQTPRVLTTLGVILKTTWD
ncbi:hypothetical protein VOLCADRAFT_91611 [Volvox carteri f. nagariensis]|uniref:Uncharacterized protein n=1 Tax=Volvox carteri f. nagariensis TaxID=3068 RepID=D8TXJ1_VOLCA|nr:uncharacterized protein VOLCADRAFT_91611 [Volvox carteri f. nagariensis]EFJ47731.1 hypothetical protein VOLCADRAFT_91611 [Volvox carteri f. nagariensis]|eukprot:XP_002951202.1 hypothetical protein VOLCADRAFT_91611 [Volvox carteri f. nagariensis]